MIQLRSQMTPDIEPKGNANLQMLYGFCADLFEIAEFPRNVTQDITFNILIDLGTIQMNMKIKVIKDSVV